MSAIAPAGGSRAVRGARVLRVPIGAIVLACVAAALLDVALSFSLGFVLDRQQATRVLHMRASSRDVLEFQSLAGAQCFLGDLGATPLDLARVTALRGLRWGLTIGLALSLAASPGLLRVRLGAAR